MFVFLGKGHFFWATQKTTNGFNCECPKRRHMFSVRKSTNDVVFPEYLDLDVFYEEIKRELFCS